VSILVLVRARERKCGTHGLERFRRWAVMDHPLAEGNGARDLPDDVPDN
jgi:hypothetical protein